MQIKKNDANKKDDTNKKKVDANKKSDTNEKADANKKLMQIKMLMQIKSMRSTGFELSLSKLTAGFRLSSMWLSNADSEDDE